MKHRDDDQMIGVQSKIDHVRKTTHQRSAGLTTDQRILIWVGLNRLEARKQCYLNSPSSLSEMSAYQRVEFSMSVTARLVKSSVTSRP